MKYPLANIKGKSYEVVPLGNKVTCRQVRGVPHVDAGLTSNIEELSKYPVVKHRGTNLRKLPKDTRCNVVQGQTVALLPVASIEHEDFEKFLGKAIEQGSGFVPNARKKFISTVYDEYRAQGGALSRGAFNKKLWDLHLKEKIDLSRADLVSVMDPKKVAESLYEHLPGVRFHFIALGAVGLGALALMFRKKPATQSSIAGEPSPQLIRELERLSTNGKL